TLNVPSIFFIWVDRDFFSLFNCFFTSFSSGDSSRLICPTLSTSLANSSLFLTSLMYSATSFTGSSGSGGAGITSRFVANVYPPKYAFGLTLTPVILPPVILLGIQMVCTTYLPCPPSLILGD